MKKNVHKSIATMSLLVLTSLPAVAQVEGRIEIPLPGLEIHVGRTAPPRLRVERRPVRPGRDFVWLPGFWHWQGVDWGWTSAATLGCFAVAIISGFLFVRVEKRAEAPLVDLHLLRNRILIGSTLAILIVAGTINALMYVLSLYFQNPSALGMSAFEAGLATLPAAAAMIAITPLIAPVAARIMGSTSRLDSISWQMVFGLRWPGQRTIAGTRTPPS